ncbi:MAG: hypothetical protein R3324_16415, partial [Halobacteriales archaeon]|nr:hypothetical protein [Halobacteriales archaeon]
MVDAALVWTTSDSAVVTVDTTGMIQAEANGVARIRASVPGDAVMGSADVVVDQTAVRVAFAVEPSVTISEAPFDPAVEVTVVDALENPVLDESPPVTVTLAVNPSGAELLGTVERNSVEGVSRFPDLAVDRAGSGYRLSVSVEGLPPDTSAAFRIDPGPFAYVADNEDGTVSVVKVATGERVALVSVGVRPYGLAASPDGSKVYVSNGLSNSVSVIETSSNTVIAEVPVGEGPREVAMTPDGFGLVVHGNIHQDSVWYVDTSDQTVGMKAEVAKGNEGIAVSPDGSIALVTASADDVLSVLDVDAGTTLMNIPVGDYPRRVAISPDGSRGFVTLYRPEQLAVVGLPGGEVLERVELSNNPVDVAVAPDGSRVFVTHSPFSTTVSVLDAATRELV